MHTHASYAYTVHQTHHIQIKCLIAYTYTPAYPHTYTICITIHVRTPHENTYKHQETQHTSHRDAHSHHTNTHTTCTHAFTPHVHD